MAKSLIIHADDLGYPEGTVEAIEQLFQSGIVTSASAMVNQSCWSQAADLLRRRPELDAGVHLVMNEGKPLLPAKCVSSLVDNTGNFRSGSSLLYRYPLISQKELKAEWEAQIEKFIDDVGRRPSHLDLHCHYPYVFPAWFRLSVDLAVSLGRIPVRLPFDDDLDIKAAELSKSYGGFPVWVIKLMGRRYQRIVRKKALPYTNYWESSFSQDGNRTVDVLLNILDRLPEGITELLCHPGAVGWRALDLDALSDNQVKERIDRLNIRLTNFQEL
ncbi:MAG: ChbG/HpnK family deacetylase [Anaerolineales bacterium]|nr:ChbG/HpnK family deacetylase [Anaerolineales bacterium]